MKRLGIMTLLSFFAVASISCSELDKQRIVGNWSCEGRMNGVEIEFDSTFSSSGELSTRSKMSVRSDDDLDGDGYSADRIEFNTIDVGSWDVSNNGYLETKTNSSKLILMTLEGESVPSARAESFYSNLTSSAMGVPLSYKINSISDNAMSLSVSGEDVECER